MEFNEIKSSEEAFIAGYGDGGFRMGESRFEGSMLITPNGFYPWAVTNKDAITVESLSPILEVAENVEILIIGMGEKMAFLERTVLFFTKKQQSTQRPVTRRYLVGDTYKEERSRCDPTPIT